MTALSHWPAHQEARTMTRYHVWGVKNDGSPYYKGSYAQRASALTVARKYTKRYRREYQVTEGPDTLTPAFTDCRLITRYVYQEATP